VIIAVVMIITIIVVEGICEFSALVDVLTKKPSLQLKRCRS
jgi:hypothetical protein